MPFSFSGEIATGAQEALDQVLDRRMKEQIRQAQEKQHAEQIAVQRKQIELQQRRDQAMDQERALDRQWRTEQGNIATADRTLKRTMPGQISEGTAKSILLDPANAGMVSQRKVIDARPVGVPSMMPGAEGVPPQVGPALSAPLDASGPQQFNVLEPTPEQAKTQFRQSHQGPAIEAIVKAPNEDARRVAYAQAIKEGLEPNDIPRDLVGSTEAEKRKTALQMQIDAEDRADKTWQKHRAQTESDLRSRPTKGGLADMTSGEAAAMFKLQDDFARDSKPFTVIRDAYQRVSQAAGAKGAVANMAMIFGFMKILDPTSVVREGEYATAQNATNIPGTIRNMYNKAIEGGFLNEQQTADFAKIAKGIYDDALYNQTGVVEDYVARSRQVGVPAEMVIRDLDTVGKREREKSGSGSGGGGYDAYLNRGKPKPRQ